MTRCFTRGWAALGVMAVSTFHATGLARAATGPTSDSARTADASPQYAKAGNWLARPSHPNKPVDVFYLYPTSYFKTSPSEPVISTINDPGMVAGAKTSFAQQATAFNTVANVYAPYYRQADARRTPA